MRHLIGMLLAGAAAAAQAQPAPPLPGAPWNGGADDCSKAQVSPLQRRHIDVRTFAFRQNPCASFEANFLYLVVGDDRALLIDTGAISDAARMPLVAQVRELSGGKPLIVAHTHGHRDHRDGDALFANQPDVRIVPPDESGVRSFYGFARWPEGVAQVDLGGRTVEVLPAPGHDDDHVVFYDRESRTLFTGDFLLPGRITVSDIDAFRASAHRVAAFVRERPVTRVLGGHVEMDRAGRLYPHGATYHPDERPLELARADVLALPAAMDGFNGFYARHANFVITNPIRNLMAVAGLVVLLLGVLVWLSVRAIRRRRARVAARA
ncbi:MBL fold metallo-hydrolase [Lysobacter sp. LF1]|uniref:MBL fold metallo-hydrolase n=1 Tax=Lysobacter stagni TaxID=3045172 RepID=A0ABT6XBN7_9GAMM|nr:MBL fold metallo-hydrolase [Lysobacter sp. LF1]MDI9237555.1 MBL fold metallo-hydrolase [Lysobacter sp. LF1]